MKNTICQSCGMPLYKSEQYGTNEQGNTIEDYCIYCYKDGAFTQDVTIDEMIKLCARYVDGNTKEVAIANMRTQFPHLKRWAKKEETQHQYHKSINKVLDYIQTHLSENPDLGTLAKIANISPYHFLRIFKAVIGEKLGEYVQRLRLEFVAEKLKHTNYSLSELAEQAGYSTEQALSRAFKKYFNIPPSVFKQSHYQQQADAELIPRICKMGEKNAVCLANNSPADINEQWKKLYMFAMLGGLLNEQSETLELLEGMQPNYYNTPCLTIEEQKESNKNILFRKIPAGIYAIFTHKGSDNSIPAFYAAILNQWLLVSKYTLSPNGITYLKYLNNPAEVPENDLLTEVYILVEGN